MSCGFRMTELTVIGRKDSSAFGLRMTKEKCLLRMTELVDVLSTSFYCHPERFLPLSS